MEVTTELFSKGLMGKTITVPKFGRASEAAPKERRANVHVVRQEDKVLIFNEQRELTIRKLSRGVYLEIIRAKLHRAE